MRRLKFGVVELHSNPCLRRQFSEVTKDLTDAGCIVDLWIHDIAAVLEEHGYQMTITTGRPSPERSER